MPLRLAIVVSHPIQYLAPFHREIARLGELDLQVLFCSDQGLEEYVDPGFRQAIRWDIPLTDGYPHEFLPRTQRRMPGFLAHDNPTVGAALDRYQPDVVLAHGYASTVFWRVSAWARRHARPLMLFSDSNALMTHAGPIEAVKRILVGACYRRIDAAFCVGDNNRAYHLRYGLPEERILSGVFPVDRERLLAGAPDRDRARRTARERHGIPADAFVALYCGKYLAIKRPLDLLRAARLAQDRGSRFWCLLVGEGPERPQLERFIAESRLADSVLTGFVNQSGLPEYYAAGDLLALPTEEEPYGLVALEAAVFGLPLVASDRLGCLGPGDVARPGRNALAFRCGDIEALRESIERLRDDASLRRAMGAESARIAEGRDVHAAAGALARATEQLHELGPRRGRLAGRRELVGIDSGKPSG